MLQLTIAVRDAATIAPLDRRSYEGTSLRDLLDDAFGRLRPAEGVAWIHIDRDESHP